jgi:hypothetical protein
MIVTTMSLLVPHWFETKPSHPAKRGTDAGLTSLLSELGSIPQNAATCDKSSAKAPFKSEIMGHSFLQVKTSILSKAKQAEIVNVHKPNGETVGTAKTWMRSRGRNHPH